jgi:chromosome segregation ATPase
MTPDAANPQQKPAEDPEALKDEIRRTRDDLGDTVEALAQKADVKAQAKQRIDEGKEHLRDYRQQAQAQAAQATEQAKQRPGAVIAGVGGLIALLLLLRIIRR